MKYRYKTWLGYYYRALETTDFVYYVNFQEGDENACVHMYRKSNNELVSNNYFAYNDMFGVIEDKKYTWASRNMKRNIKLSLEAEKN